MGKKPNNYDADPELRLSFVPAAIREAEPEKSAPFSDAQLAEAAATVLDTDSVWQEFHRLAVLITEQAQRRKDAEDQDRRDTWRSRTTHAGVVMLASELAGALSEMIAISGDRQLAEDRPTRGRIYLRAETALKAAREAGVSP